MLSKACEGPDKTSDLIGSFRALHKSAKKLACFLFDRLTKGHVDAITGLYRTRVRRHQWSIETTKPGNQDCKMCLRGRCGNLHREPCSWHHRSVTQESNIRSYPFMCWPPIFQRTRFKSQLKWKMNPVVKRVHQWFFCRDFFFVAQVANIHRKM